MTEGQSKLFTNGVPEVAFLYPYTCYILVVRVGMNGNNSTNTLHFTKKPLNAKNVHIKCIIFFYISHTCRNYMYINVSVYMYK